MVVGFLCENKNLDNGEIISKNKKKVDFSVRLNYKLKIHLVFFKKVNKKRQKI